MLDFYKKVYKERLELIPWAVIIISACYGGIMRGFAGLLLGAIFGFVMNVLFFGFRNEIKEMIKDITYNKNIPNAKVQNDETLRSLAPKCQSCNADVKADDTFCMKCGANLKV